MTEILHDGQGKCYEQAAKFFLAISPTTKGLVLIHGRIRLDSGREIDHAWVEDTHGRRVFWDLGYVTNEAATRTPPVSFDYFYNRVISVRSQYTSPKVVAYLIEKTGTWGPNKWIEETEKAVRRLIG